MNIKDFLRFSNYVRGLQSTFQSGTIGNLKQFKKVEQLYKDPSIIKTVEQIVKKLSSQTGGSVYDLLTIGAVAAEMPYESGALLLFILLLAYGIHTDPESIMNIFDDMMVYNII